MKYLFFLILISLFACQKYEYEVLGLADQPDIVLEETDGVVVFLKNQQAYIVDDLGQNQTEIPNTSGATYQVSLNYTKDKIAYFNASDEIVVINIDGTGKQVLNQYDPKDFEWSLKEDVLFILENNRSSITLYGNSSSFVSPQFAVNLSVLRFTVSEDYQVAYSSVVQNPPYSDVFQVKSADSTVYFSVFSGGDPHRFLSLQYTSENKVFGAYLKGGSDLYTCYFDPATEGIAGNNNYVGFSQNWTYNVKHTFIEELKNIRTVTDNANGFNIYNIRANGTSKQVTFFSGTQNPIPFDWKK